MPIDDNRPPSPRTASRLIDLTGMRFGRLTVVSRGPNVVTPSGNKYRRWHCVCDCGNRTLPRAHSLRSGNTRSCGRHCKASPNWRPGARGTREYRSWSGMMQRCFNPNNNHYPYYGGRGITVCDRWRNSFEAFLEDMGPRPKGTSIDRWPDKEGNYEPGNCRWATPAQQATNTRANIMIDIGGGVDASLSEWCRVFGLNVGTVYGRITKSGYSPRDALFTPVRRQLRNPPSPPFRRRPSSPYNFQLRRQPRGTIPR